MTYTATPHDVRVDRVQNRISDLKRQRSILMRDSHPLAKLDAVYCGRAIHDLQYEIEAHEAARA